MVWDTTLYFHMARHCLEVIIGYSGQRRNKNIGEFLDTHRVHQNCERMRREARSSLTAGCKTIGHLDRVRGHWRRHVDLDADKIVYDLADKRAASRASPPQAPL
ncbi:hypothetical protein BKA93DRAFT_755773 [Sparassis latifolia]